jgi:hypothetical protein
MYFWQGAGPANHIKVLNSSLSFIYFSKKYSVLFIDKGNRWRNSPILILCRISFVKCDFVDLCTVNLLDSYTSTFFIGDIPSMPCMYLEWSVLWKWTERKNEDQWIHYNSEVQWLFTVVWSVFLLRTDSFTGNLPAITSPICWPRVQYRPY